VGRILIVEDDDSLREALIGLMRTLGYRARGFCSAEDLTAKLMPGSEDCIITDVHLPGINGIEMTQRLRALGHAVPSS
jgi:FixJ family two-component response regulator